VVPLAEWFRLDDSVLGERWHLRTGDVLQDQTIVTACNLRVKVSAIDDTRSHPPFERECPDCRRLADPQRN
jgi:hypothetical protein